MRLFGGGANIIQSARRGKIPNSNSTSGIGNAFRRKSVSPTPGSVKSDNTYARLGRLSFPAPGRFAKAVAPIAALAAAPSMISGAATNIAMGGGGSLASRALTTSIESPFMKHSPFANTQPSTSVKNIGALMRSQPTNRMSPKNIAITRGQQHFNNMSGSRMGQVGISGNRI